jgi:cytochrome oxidase Cu insertion factor (SCO1/SenC/PrrC family)
LVFVQMRTVRAHAIVPTYGNVPAFVLLDHAQQTISRETLRGSIWIADFIFTRCAGQCPLMSARMAALASALRRESSVRLVSFTVDPTWDTPPVLAEYAKRYGAAGEQWRFLTGDQATIVRLCTEGFRLSIAEDGGTPEEPITHSVRLVLVDRAARIRGYYDATDEVQVKRLRDDLRRLLREER